MRTSDTVRSESDQEAVKQPGSRNALGAILCKHCGELIDTLDTDRVQVMYGLCSNEACLTKAQSGAASGGMC